jgi:hypothetical protein
MGLLAIAGGLFSQVLSAQLTAEQKVQDFTSMATVFAKRYAPANWKIENLGVNLFQISPWLDRVRATRSDLEFIGVCMQYVSSLKDGHSQLYGPGNLVLNSGISVDYYDDKPLIEGISRSILPLREYPFQIGDELVSIDGKPFADIVARLSRLHDYGHPALTRRIAALLATFPQQSFDPEAALIPAESEFAVRRQSGALETYKIRWQRSGTPLMQIPRMPGFFSTERSAPVSQTIQNGINIESEVPTWRQLFNKRKHSARALPMVADLKRGRMYLGSGSNRPVWSFPTNFQLRVGRSSLDFMTTGTYLFEGKRIGYVRFGTFDLELTNSQLAQLDSEINYMSANTDGLVLDVMRNPGGFGCEAVEMMRRFMPTTFKHFSAQMRPVFEDIAIYDELLEIFPLLGAPNYIIELLRFERQQILDAYRNGRALTGPIPYCYYTDDVPSVANAYRKPVILLVDDASNSAADIFPAIFQDNARGKVVGTRTGGLGGAVGILPAGQFAEMNTGMTVNLLVRSKEQQYAGFPKTNYLENVGVVPDTELSYMTKDNLLNSGRPFVEAFSRILVERINAGN